MALLITACGSDGGTGPGQNQEFGIVGIGEIRGRFTSDLWVHGDHAYTGTWGGSTARSQANVLFVWDVADPADPVLVDSVRLDARNVNDVKISADGGLGVVTHENSPDGLNGITLLDLSDPGSPSVITRYTTNLEQGVHNVWIDGDFLYVAQDGGVGDGRLRILDISDPAAPFEVADFSDPGSALHDVHVRDGLAFLSFLNSGLIILDVGNGIRGGSPTSPVEVSRNPLDGAVHNAWYWPAGELVFVGEERFTDPGPMRVVDVSDLSNPVEVATFEQDRISPPHNFWMDESREILYMAWYAEGLIALDVSGTLSGRLETQDRVRGVSLPFGPGAGCPSPSGTGTCVWAPQLHRGLVFASDIHNGLVVLEPEF